MTVPLLSLLWVVSCISRDLCSRIAELLWVFLWPGLRSSFDTEMAGDGIVRWRPRCESGMNSGSDEANRKMVLDSEKSRFCSSCFCLVHFICLSIMRKICLVGNQVCLLLCLPRYIKHGI